MTIEFNWTNSEISLDDIQDIKWSSIMWWVKFHEFLHLFIKNKFILFLVKLITKNTDMHLAATYDEEECVWTFARNWDIIWIADKNWVIFSRDITIEEDKEAEVYEWDLKTFVTYNKELSDKEINQLYKWKQ